MKEYFLPVKFPQLDKKAFFRRTGYWPFTTFYEDFTIAEAFGASAVRETFQRAKREWSIDYKYFTELLLMIELKMHECYMNGDEDLLEAYCEIVDKGNMYRKQHFDSEASEYFYGVFQKVFN